MKKHVSFVLVVLTVLAGSYGCSKKQPAVAVEVKPAFVEKFIKVHLKADPDLNLYAGTSHALHLCMYQLIEPNTFNQFSEDEAGLSKLMSCERFDPGVAFAKRVILQPGKEEAFEMDRAEGAKFVGVVAGYYSLQKKDTVRLYTIPVFEAKKGVQPPLNVDLLLGPQGIIKSGDKP